MFSPALDLLHKLKDTFFRVQGVMLTHGNLKYQMDNLSFFLKPKPGERSLSLLPPWHIYERSCGYYLFSRACTQVHPLFNICSYY